MRTFRALLAVASLLFAAGCATHIAPSPHPVEWTTIQATPPGATFSHELATLGERRAAFQHAWRIVNDRFYDPKFNGVDWDGTRARYLAQVDQVDSDNAFYALVSRMVGELKDSHTRVYTPRDYRNRLDSVISTFGLRVAEVDGKVAIVQVFPDTDAARAGLKKGMVIETIDGEKAIDRLAKLRAESPEDVSPERRTRGIFGRLISGRSDRLALDVAPVAGAPGNSSYELKRNDREIPLQVAHETLAGNIGYVAFNRFRNEAASDFSHAVAGLRGTDGLIIDLRGNPGGSLGAMLSIARNFFPETRHVMTRQLRPMVTSSPEGEGFGSPRSISDSAPPEMRILASPAAYTQPIAVLLDNYSASSSELLATILREQRGAAIIGRPTCGCVVAVRPNGYKLAGGGALYVSESGFVSPYGTRMEGVPMKPDREVALKLADLEAGIDRDILVAKEMLHSRLSKEADAPLN